MAAALSMKNSSSHPSDSTAEESIKHHVGVFKKLAQIPSVSSAQFALTTAERQQIDVKLSIRSYSSMSRHVKRTSLTGSRNASHELSPWLWQNSSPSIDSKDDPIKAVHHFGSGTDAGQIVLRETSTKTRHVELWKGERLLKIIDVTEKHENFITNSEAMVVTVERADRDACAEAKAPKKSADWASREPKLGSDGLENFEYEPSLGEGFDGQNRPTLFLLKMQRHCDQDMRIVQIGSGEFLESAALFGQASFHPGGKKIVLVAHLPIVDGRRLGVAACTNRPSIVCEADIDHVELERLWRLDKEDHFQTDKARPYVWNPKHWNRISRLGFSARSPRYLNLQGTCAWLESEQGGAHRDCDALVCNDGKGQITVEIPIQDLPSPQNDWPGLFSDNLSDCCALRDGDTTALVMTTIWGSRRTIVLYALGTRDKMDERQLWSYSLLCTNNKDTLVAVRSSPSQAQQILIGHITNDWNVEWSLAKDLFDEWEEDSDLQGLNKIVTRISHVPSTESSSPVEAITVQPANENKGTWPCILAPHGGPHSASTTEFSPSIAAFCLSGYCIVLPNYHGSLGRGQKYAHSLVGKCGTLDVRDCLDCVHHVVSTSKIADPLRIFVDGGSHGGFLALHLVGQHPNTFRAAIARNPVTAANLMEGTNDIPDWFYAEFGLPFDFSQPPSCISSEQFEVLAKASPLRHLNSIKAPVLLLTGDSDQRVAPSQSKLVYHALKHRNMVQDAQQSRLQSLAVQSVRMLMFDKQSHPLDGVETELVAWEARLRWLCFSTESF